MPAHSEVRVALHYSLEDSVRVGICERRHKTFHQPKKTKGRVALISRFSYKAVSRVQSQCLNL